VNSRAAPLLTTLCREHPNLRPQIREEGSAQLQELLIRGALEIAVSPMRPDNPAVGSELLFREPLVLAAPAGMGLPDHMALPDLARLPWVTTQRRHAVRVMVDALFAEAGLEPRVVAEIDSLSTVVRFVQRGLGVAILPQKVAEHARAEGGLAIVATAAPLPERSMFLCWRRSTQSSRRTDFVLALIRDLARNAFDPTRP
jgi:DNA-binding transcriptional LysR family regulator